MDHDNRIKRSGNHFPPGRREALVMPGQQFARLLKPPAQLAGGEDIDIHIGESTGPERPGKPILNPQRDSFGTPGGSVTAGRKVPEGLGDGQSTPEHLREAVKEMLFAGEGKLHLISCRV
jgi:hypothetical protein